MGVGERYHGVVRRVFNRVSADHADLDDEIILAAAAVKAVNDSVGVDGLDPTLLVFGTMPKLPHPGADDGAMAQTDRLAAMAKARDEYSKIVDEQRLNIIAEARQPSVPTDLTYGEKVCVYRQASKTWDGPFRFVGDNGFLFFVLMDNGDIDRFQKPTVKRYSAGLPLDTLSSPASTMTVPPATSPQTQAAQPDPPLQHQGPPNYATVVAQPPTQELQPHPQPNENATNFDPPAGPPSQHGC